MTEGELIYWKWAERHAFYKGIIVGSLIVGSICALITIL